jgi:hypothetical protein
MVQTNSLILEKSRSRFTFIRFWILTESGSAFIFYAGFESAQNECKSETLQHKSLLNIPPSCQHTGDVSTQAQKGYGALSLQKILFPIEMIFSCRLHPECLCMFDLKISINERQIFVKMARCCVLFYFCKFIATKVLQG